jgi:hypothetical protein
MAGMSLCVHRQSLELAIRGDFLRLTDTPKKEKRPLSGALQGPTRRGKSNGAGTIHLFRRIRVVMSANYDGEIPQPLNVNPRHARLVSWMEQKGQ